MNDQELNELAPFVRRRPEEESEASTADQAPELQKAVNAVRERGAKFREQHGSVECTVAPDNVLAQNDIQLVDGIKIHVESGVAFLSFDSEGKVEGDTKLEGPLVYFHKADHMMFGSEFTGCRDCGYLDCECWR